MVSSEDFSCDLLDFILAHFDSKSVAIDLVFKVRNLAIDYECSRDCDKTAILNAIRHYALLIYEFNAHFPGLFRKIQKYVHLFSKEYYG